MKTKTITTIQPTPTWTELNAPLVQIIRDTKEVVSKTAREMGIQSWCWKDEPQYCKAIQKWWMRVDNNKMRKAGIAQNLFNLVVAYYITLPTYREISGGRRESWTTAFIPYGENRHFSGITNPENLVRRRKPRFFRGYCMRNMRGLHRPF